MKKVLQKIKGFLRWVLKRDLYIYERLIAVFITLSIPSFVISAVSNRNAARLIRTDIMNALNSEMQFYADIFDQQINQLLMQQVDLLNNNDLQDISLINTIDSYPQVQKIDALKRYLVSIRNSSKFADDIGVYIRSIGKTLSAKYNLSNIPNSTYNILELYFKQKLTGNPVFYSADGSIYIIRTLTYKYNKSFHNLPYISFIKLDKKQINVLLSSMCNHKNSFALLFNDDRLIDISGTDNVNIYRVAGYIIENEGNIEKNKSVTINREKYIITYTDLKSINLKAYLCIPVKELYGNLEKNEILFILFSIISIMVFFAFAFYINMTIHQPFRNLTQSIEAYKSGNMNSFMKYYDKNDEFSYIYRHFEELVRDLNKYINEIYEQKIISQQLELKQLQSQINPHFLYNCFYNVYRLCKSEDYGTLLELTRQLGRYYEYITRNGEDEVTVESEYTHAKSYLEIQAIRYVNMIEITMNELPEEVKSYYVPKLILQPIIENAFIHGFSVKKKGSLAISFYFHDGVFVFKVEDDGDGLPDSELTALQEKLKHPEKVVEKTGVLNICRRLKLRFGNDSGVFIERNSNNGITCSLVIHFKKGAV